MEVQFRNPVKLYISKIGFRFDLTAWVLLSQATETEYGEWSDLPENKFTTALFFGAYCSFCIEHKKRRKYDLQDIYRLKRFWEKHNPEIVLLMKKTGIESAYLGEAMTKQVKQSDEKKN